MEVGVSYSEGGEELASGGGCVPIILWRGGRRDGKA